jgi:hypothetical protein
VVVLLLALLISLFFNVLFFQGSTRLVCLDEHDTSTCKAFSCPPCRSLYGEDCGTNLLSPAEVCENYASAHKLQHAACMERPFSLCTAEGGYTDTLCDGTCDEGELMTLHDMSVTTHGGETTRATEVLTGCTEYGKSASETIAAALVSAACTIPLMVLLQAGFQLLRRPHELAIIGERRNCFQLALARCVACGQEMDEAEQAHKLSKHIQPETIEAVTPERLNRWTPCAASLTYGFALAVGLACTMLIALVLINFDAEMTKEWLLATLITSCTTWLTDPLLAMLTVYFVALVGRLSCQKRTRVVQNRFRRVHTASSLFSEGSTPHAATLTAPATETVACSLRKQKLTARSPSVDMHVEQDLVEETVAVRFLWRFARVHILKKIQTILIIYCGFVKAGLSLNPCRLQQVTTVQVADLELVERRPAEPAMEPLHSTFDHRSTTDLRPLDLHGP